MEDKPKYESRRTSSSGKIIDSVDVYSMQTNVGYPISNQFERNSSRMSSLRRTSPMKMNASDSHSKLPVTKTFSLQATPNSIRKIPQYVSSYATPATLARVHSSSARLPEKDEMSTLVKKSPAMSLHQNYFHQ